MRTCIAAIALLIAAAGTAGAAPAFDPRSFRDAVEGPPTRVLVLGTPHLSGAPETFDPAVLEPLLIRLADRSGVDLTAAFARKLAKARAKYPIDGFKGSNRKYNEPRTSER